MLFKNKSNVIFNIALEIVNTHGFFRFTFDIVCANESVPY